MRRPHAFAALSASLAAPLVTWWAAGGLSEPAVYGGLDYIVEPPRLSRATERALGLSASAVLVVSLAALLTATVHGGLPVRAWGVIIPPLVVGALAGLGFRVVTAGTAGANIGGGMVMLATPVVLAAALATVVVQWRRMAASPVRPTR